MQNLLRRLVQDIVAKKREIHQLQRGGPGSRKRPRSNSLLARTQQRELDKESTAKPGLGLGPGPDSDTASPRRCSRLTLYSPAEKKTISSGIMRNTPPSKCSVSVQCPLDRTDSEVAVARRELTLLTLTEEVSLYSQQIPRPCCNVASLLSCTGARTGPAAYSWMRW